MSGRASLPRLRRRRVPVRGAGHDPLHRCRDKRQRVRRDLAAHGLRHRVRQLSSTDGASNAAPGHRSAPLGSPRQLDQPLRSRSADGNLAWHRRSLRRRRPAEPGFAGQCMLDRWSPAASVPSRHTSSASRPASSDPTTTTIRRVFARWLRSNTWARKAGLRERSEPVAPEGVPGIRRMSALSNGLSRSTSAWHHREPAATGQD